MKAIPKAWFSNDYSLWQQGEQITEQDCSNWREAATIELGGAAGHTFKRDPEIHPLRRILSCR